MNDEWMMNGWMDNRISHRDISIVRLQIMRWQDNVLPMPIDEWIDAEWMAEWKNR